jgi:hemoglobin
MGLLNRHHLLRAAGLSASLFVGACLTLSTGCARKNDKNDKAEKRMPATKPTTRPTTRSAVSRTGTLFDRLGGEASIRKVVDDFVRRAAADPAVNFTRKGHANEWKATPHNLERLKQRLVEFVATTSGGPARHQYHGKDMVSAHKGMGISNAEFDALTAHLAAALDANKVSRREREELLNAVASTRGAIVEVPDRSPSHADTSPEDSFEGDPTADAPTDEVMDEPTTEYGPDGESTPSEDSTPSDESTESDGSSTEDSDGNASEEDASEEYQPE